MNSIFKGTTAIAVGLLAFTLLGTPLASADEGKHGTMDKKINDCHEAHEKMKGGDMSGDHMKGCHDKDGKLIGNKDGHMGKDMKMPMADHKMDKKMRGSN